MSEEKPKYNMSYTSYSTYHQCPDKWKKHYFDKIRPTSQPSYFVFGSAGDKGFNELLLHNGDVAKAMEAARTELFRLFTEEIDVEAKDYDGELITDQTRGFLTAKLQSVGWTGSNPDVLAQSLFERAMFGETLNDNQKKMVKYLVYYSFEEKLTLMFEAYNTYILPRIEKVHSVQKNVKRGIMDFEATITGYGQCVIDNKTASRAYQPDAVFWSVQLAGYGAEKGMYIVFEKTVKKNREKQCKLCGNSGTGKRHKTCDAIVDTERCNGDWLETIRPEVIPQIVFGEIPEHNRQMVEQAYADTEKLIEAKVFPKNLTNCQSQFGKPCPYINLCWHGKMDGLKIDVKT